MTFSLIHPSIRPNKWREIYDAWIKAAAQPGNVQYLLAVDAKWGFGETRDIHDWALQRATESLPHRNALIWTTGKSYVESVNLAAKEATGGVFIVIADDIWPPLGWDEAIATGQWMAMLHDEYHHYTTGPEDALEFAIWVNNGGSAEFAIWVNNGGSADRRDTIMEMPVVSRSRVERLGYLYYPDYLSMYADQDLAEHCKLDAAEERCSLIRLDEPVFPHFHPVNDPSVKVDEQYRWQNRPEAYAVGRRILEARRAAKFTDVKVEPLPKRTRMAVCVMGNSFALPWVIRWTNIIQLGATHFDLDLHFGYGITNVYHARIGMAREVLNDSLVPEYVLWIDHDQLVEPHQIVQLVKDLEEHPELAMVAGWTVCGVDSYRTEPMISCGIEEGKRAFAKDLFAWPGDLVEVLYTGFPLVVMRYELLKELGAQAFFPLYTVNDLPPGEDVSFCARARDKDLKIAVDRRVGPLPHLKLANIAAEVKPE